ncbi:DUF4012 domain-containing protein [Demequina sp.]|uniref:DUF4012 domain-containing protein n=1 Tax=Demequina sp. TaxID=2050685 RepID=UPI003D0B17E1
MTASAVRHARSKPAGARGLRLSLTLVALVVLGVATYAAFQTWGMVSGVMALRNAAPVLADTAESGDLGALESQVLDLRDAAAEGANHANNWSVRAVAHLPLIGNDVEAVRQVSLTAASLTDVGAATLGTVKGAQEDPGAGLPIETLVALHAHIDDFQARTREGHDNLAKIDVASLKVAPLAEQLPRLTDALDDATTTLDRAESLIAGLAVLTTNDTPRTWLVINQNLTEARGSGGLLSTYAVIHVRNGVVELAEQGTNDDLAAMGDADPSSAPSELRDYWGDELTQWWGLNESADFPTTAQIIADSWGALSETPIDGVVTFGQGTVQYLAAATGPVTVRGATIAPSDLSEYLTQTVYRDYPDPVEKDTVVSEIIGEVFQKIAAGDLDIQALVRTVLTTPNADYLQIWSADPDEQQQIVAAGLSGQMPDSLGPVASVRAVNVAGNKLEAFLHVGVTYTLGACVADDAAAAMREASLTVDVTNSAPTTGLPAYMTGRLDLPAGTPYTEGSTLTDMLIYPPVDAMLNTALLDGEDVGAGYGFERNREFVSIPVELQPGQARTITVTWLEPAEDEDGKALSGQPQVILPPLINEATVSAPISAACR